MAEIAESHIDPTGRYFSAVGYAYDTRSDTPTIWTPQGGALAFQLFRPDGGATEVYVQIATSQRYAVRCGATTGHCLHPTLHGRQPFPPDLDLGSSGGGGAVQPER